jgi:CRISPR-associated exonuclease Cas4
MYPESDLLPISALQHIVFCERQCALIHIERQWEENRLTAEGRILHDRTDKEEVESRGDLRIARALNLQNRELGIFGKADVVEFTKSTDGTGIMLPDVAGLWKPYPVEYKRGKPKLDHCDEVQLCAQALCLEEMLVVKIDEGALYYGTPRRRTVIQFDDKLRNDTAILIIRLRNLIRSRVTPKARYEKKCDNCSLINICMPKLNNTENVEEYINSFLDSIEKEDDETFT